MDTISRNVTNTLGRVIDIQNQLELDKEKLRALEKVGTPALIESAAYYGEISIGF